MPRTGQEILLECVDLSRAPRSARTSSLPQGSSELDKTSLVPPRSPFPCESVELSRAQRSARTSSLPQGSSELDKASLVAPRILASFLVNAWNSPGHSALLRRLFPCECGDLSTAQHSAGTSSLTQGSSELDKASLAPLRVLPSFSENAWNSQEHSALLEPAPYRRVAVSSMRPHWFPHESSPRTSSVRQSISHAIKMLPGRQSSHVIHAKNTFDRKLKGVLDNRDGPTLEQWPYSVGWRACGSGRFGNFKVSKKIDIMEQSEKAAGKQKPAKKYYFVDSSL